MSTPLPDPQWALMPYILHYRPWLPWVIVYDTDGFPDASMNDYLHYVACGLAGPSPAPLPS